MAISIARWAGLVQFPLYRALDVQGHTSLIAVGGVAPQRDAQAIEDALDVRTRASIRCLRDFDGVLQLVANERDQPLFAPCVST